LAVELQVLRRKVEERREGMGNEGGRRIEGRWEVKAKSEQ